MANSPRTTTPRPSNGTFALVTGLLTMFGASLYLVTGHAPETVSPKLLLAPMIVLAGLTGVAWVCMVVLRNLSVLLGAVSIAYYRSYTEHTPPEWIERPARIYANLLEAPLLFYVLCLALLALAETDRTQLQLAWIFVVMRTVHAFVYAAWNHVPTRFACWTASTITLAVLWFRFAAAHWPGVS